MEHNGTLFERLADSAEAARSDSEDDFYSVHSGECSDVSSTFLSVASATPEDLSCCCDPCLKQDRRKRAKKYCPSCKQNFCSNCLRYHASFNSSSSHRLWDNPRETTDAVSPLLDSIDLCSVHDNSTIKFFCRDHSKVGCGDCMTLFHASCTKEYIPEICTDVLRSQEFFNTISKINESMDKAEAMVRKAKAIELENRKFYQEAVTEIEKFYKDVTDVLADVKKRLIQQAETEYKVHHSTLNTVSSEMATIINDLRSCKATIESCKEVYDSAKLFIALKNVQETIKHFNLTKSEKTIYAETSFLVLMPNKDLKRMLSHITRFGTLSAKTSECVYENLFDLRLCPKETDIY